MIKYHIRRNKPSGDPPEGLFDDGGRETVEKVLFFVERYCYTLRTQQNKNFVAFGVGLCYNIDTQVTRFGGIKYEALFRLSFDPS